MGASLGSARPTGLHCGSRILHPGHVWRGATTGREHRCGGTVPDDVDTDSGQCPHGLPCRCDGAPHSVVGRAR